MRNFNTFILNNLLIIFLILNTSSANLLKAKAKIASTAGYDLLSYQNACRSTTFNCSNKNFVFNGEQYTCCKFTPDNNIKGRCDSRISNPSKNGIIVTEVIAGKKTKVLCQKTHFINSYSIYFIFALFTFILL